MIQYLPSIDSIDKSQWQKLIDSSAYASFFQTFECYTLYAKSEGIEPFVSGVTDNGVLVGIVVGYKTSTISFLSRFTARSIIPGGFVFDSHISDEALSILLNNTMRTVANRSIYLEVRNYNDYNSKLSLFTKNNLSYSSHYNYLVEPASTKTAYSKLSNSKQRQVKYSLKAGCVCYPTTDKNEIEQFYFILKELYQKKIKLPLFSLSFFLNLADSENGKIWVVKYQNNVIGGMATAELKNQSVYEWFICGKDKTYKNIYPSVLVTWSVIQYAMQHGLRFDFMGAGSPNQKYGVRTFKASFGGNLVEYGRFRYINNPFLYHLGKIIIRCKQYLK